MARSVRQNNRMRLRVEGIEELVKALRNADQQIQKELNDLVSECAEIVFREADARAPIGKTGRTRFSLRIEIGKNNKGIFYANVVVGARNGDTTATSAFYVTFYELGSSHQPPRPFMRPAFDKSKAKMRKHLIEGLERIILGLGR
ncbi:HK97 gp10 family phage protein [Bacillus sp. FJAT-49705]|uniref:HK97 gp10 family phage protein n=1 Tax=Cytobacillus citreus TaxID=2833586 RepID=A0ABS5NV84_9BACI|nr:HK97-gp10 family putative phage morphogenesis protein [Cytobacillus citreus]MBS4191746.1 HK97 gp10 family phage protein [Cytobacillus citreus]